MTPQPGSARWKPDGARIRARIGVLTPHLDPVPESEMAAIAPAGVSIHAARVPLGMVGPDGEIIPRVGPEVACAFAEPPAVDNAVASLAPLRPQAIVYAFTSSSYILGAEADVTLAARPSAPAGGVPVVIQTPAIAAALRALSIRRVALVHPPWFTVELDALGAEYFAGLGFEVVCHGPAPLHRDYGEIPPRQIFDYAVANTPEAAEALVFGGGGFRASGVIAALEARLGRPVVTANQAALWRALRLAGIADRLVDYGGLFRH